MKKVFVTFLAVASVIACTKSNVEFEETTEIGLKPVAHNVTKSMMNSTTGFYKSENFNVWAYYKSLPAGTDIATWQASSENQTDYIVEKTFENRTDTDTWGGVIPYYWPKTGSLLFVGYYPVTASESVSYEFSDAVATTNPVTPAKNRMVISNYVAKGKVQADPAHDEDFMYAHMTASSYSAKSTTKPTLIFKHALSWISVVLVKSASLPDDTEVSISNVKFTAIKPQGNAVVDGASVIKWTSEGDAAEVDVVADEETKPVVLQQGNKAVLKYEPVIIPQDMCNIVVTYTIKSKDGSKFTDVTDPIQLSGLDYSWTESGEAKKGTLAAWEPGKHYTYTITVGASEILITPAVEDWVPVTASTTVQ